MPILTCAIFTLNWFCAHRDTGAHKQSMNGKWYLYSWLTCQLAYCVWPVWYWLKLCDGLYWSYHIVYTPWGKVYTKYKLLQNYLVVNIFNSTGHSQWKLQLGHIMTKLRVRAVFHKTVRVCHVYCNFKIGFTCRIIVIFGTLKDGSLLINILASNICFSYRNMFQNGVDALSKIVDAFLSKSSKFYLVRIIW